MDEGAEGHSMRESPSVLVERLIEKVQTDGLADELVYLDSNIVEHRWDMGTSDTLKEEFEHKTIWVAKRLRDAFGSPDPSAFVQALDRFEVGLLAAAWWVRGLVAFVSLRQEMNPHTSNLDRPRFVVVLGVTEASPVERGPSGDEARAAAGIASRLLH